MRQILLLLSLRWLAAAQQRPSSKGSGVVCSFKEQTYHPGDSWHPYLEPFGFMFCMRCSCTELGRVKCSTIKCPSLRCENPVTDAQQCCPRCAEEPRIPAGLRAAVKSCRYNGSTYQPGETFTKHDLFPTRPTNQCVLCTCSNGNIFCALKTCQTLSCSSPITLPDTCCLSCRDGSTGGSSVEEGGQQLNRGVRHSVDQCAGEAMPGEAMLGEQLPGGVRSAAGRAVPRGLSLAKLHLQGAAETTVKILLQKRHQRACLYNGQTYSHGDAWHPVLGKVLECIRCTCRDGTQDCKRITCPGEYPCQHPMKTEGRCCKICPEMRPENRTQCYLGPGSSSLLVYKVEASPRDHAQDPVRVDASPRGHAQDPVKVEALPRGHSQDLRVIAVERQGTTDVQVQVWKTVGGVSQLIETAEVQRKDLMDHPENYTLLTTLNEETWRVFLQEAEKQGEVFQSLSCEDGLRALLRFLNPDQPDTSCLL